MFHGPARQGTLIPDFRDDLPRFRSDPQQSLAQVHVRTPSEARETFRGRAGSATGVAQTVRPQPGDATADSQSARLSHSPHRDVRGKRNPARRPSAGCLLCNPRVASFRLAAHGTRTRPQTPPLRGVDAGLPFARRQRRREGESRRVFRARRDWRRAGSPRGADAEAKARGLIHLAESCRRGARKSSERAVPRAAAVDKKPVSHCPAGKSGISVQAYLYLGHLGFSAPRAGKSGEQQLRRGHRVVVWG